MTKTDLINALSEKTDIVKKDVSAVLEALAAITIEELKSGKDGTRVIIPEIVVLKKAKRKATPAKTGRNPKTGEPVKIAAKKAGWKVLARPAKAIKDLF